MSTDMQTKRERRLAARDERKKQAATAQRQARLRQIILLVVLAVVLIAVVVWGFSTSFWGMATPSIGRAMPLEKAEHVPESTVIEWGSRPPTSGKHFDAWYPTYGVFEQDIPAGNWVHNLEHGAVVLLYNCPSGCADVVQQVKDLYGTLPKGRNARRGTRLLALPYKDMDHKLAVVAWGYLLELDEFDQDKITRFYEARIDRGPECNNLVCPD
ncbi:MAG: DUF3105 domain-containing protein [Chloroflexota bacterium]